jgi:uncharacterized protein (TIGR04255 family)
MPWQTAHKDHAIERVAMTFVFSEPVPTKPWVSISSALAKISLADGFLAAHLDKAIPAVPNGARVFGFAFGPGGVTLGSGEPTQFYTKQADDGLFEQLSVSRSEIAYIATRYSGWSDFRDRAIQFLGDALGEALTFVGLQIIKLEYWDRFVFEGPLVDYKSLFKADSRHVPAVAFETSELWHSHTGYFMPATSAGRQLVNVNLDMLDLAAGHPTVSGPLDEAKRSAGVYTMIQDFVGDPGSIDTLDAALPRLTAMHDDLKMICADLVTTEMGVRIGLGGS